MTGCRYVLLLDILIIGMFQDFRQQRISSRLILIGILSGFLLRFYTDSITISTAVCLAADIILPILALFPLFLLRALGAGDIKLCSLIGCLAGTPASFIVIYLAFALGSIRYLICPLIFRKRRRRQQEPFAWTFPPALLIYLIIQMIPALRGGTVF